MTSNLFFKITTAYSNHVFINSDVNVPCAQFRVTIHTRKPQPTNDHKSIFVNSMYKGECYKGFCTINFH